MSSSLARRCVALWGVTVLEMEHAMVQAIENRADIEGRVLGVKSDAVRRDHRLVTIEVDATPCPLNFAGR